MIGDDSAAELALRWPGVAFQGPAYVHPDAQFGVECEVWPFAYIGPRVRIGDRCVVHPGASVGRPGYGFERLPDGSLRRKDHPFGVVLGDDVEVGASACVDAGRHRDTVIGPGTKIDNLVHVAHNVIVGRDCLVIALAELSGSVEVGDRTWIGPSACVRDWVRIGSDVTIGIGSVVVKSVPDGETWAGCPARRLR